jgi:hypothetical protein
LPRTPSAVCDVFTNQKKTRAPFGNAGSTSKGEQFTQAARERRLGFRPGQRP